MRKLSDVKMGYLHFTMRISRVKGQRCYIATKLAALATPLSRQDNQCGANRAEDRPRDVCRQPGVSIHSMRPCTTRY